MKTTLKTAALFIFGASAALPLGGCATSQASQPVATEALGHETRFVVRASAKSFAATLSALTTALDKRGLKTFAVVDHAAGAASIGVELEPTTLVIFGNPKAGTPLIAAEPLMGGELPLKALVYERDGQVFLALTNVQGFARTYPLDQRAGVLANIEKALDGIAGEVTR
ncbi:MAG: DUF302 domain-containing protein [Pseudomonadota bacterium]